MADNPEGRSADFQAVLEEIKRLTLENNELKLELENRQLLGVRPRGTFQRRVTIARTRRMRLRKTRGQEEKIRQMIEEKEEKIRQLAKENKNQEDTIRSLQSIIDILRDGGRDKRRITRRTHQNLSQTAEEKKAGVANAMKAYKEVEAECDRFLNNYIDLKEKYQDLEKENGDINDKLDSSEKKIRKLEKKLAAYETKGKKEGYEASGKEMEEDHKVPKVEMVDQCVSFEEEEEQQEEEYESPSEEEDESSGSEFDPDGDEKGSSSDSDDEDEF
ncbi:hypothetical protein F4776DRAFT_675531 [Hypoxylon sp. NC0597]|nr:hypothetical protein F4776DRAFT_675531 [Hypoxylon sp. NC0597]